MSYRLKNKKPIIPEPPKERDYLGQAEKSKERNKRRIKVVKELGSGKSKNVKSSDSGATKIGYTGPTCKDGVDGCDVMFALNPLAWVGSALGMYNKDQEKRGGRSYKSSGKDLSDISKENAERTDKILRGEDLGGSDAYQEARRNIVYDREVMRAAIDADRELLRSGEISSEEFKKRRAAHIAENRALREEIENTYKSQKAMERGDSDFTYSPSAK